MQLARFLNKTIKKGGFILTDADSKDYIIGKPDNNPIRSYSTPKTKQIGHVSIARFGDGYSKLFLR